jgi:hypothetical protein
LENNRTAVMVDAVFSTNAGKNACAGFRLTTGDICAETRTGEGTSALSIRGKIRYVVVPDFFGDDAVWGDEAFGVSRVGLPAENFFLNLLEGGEAIVMCVWQSNEQNADVIFAGSGQKPVINACEVQSSKDKKIWVAFLESGGLWHSRVFSDKDKEKDIALDWTPPFPAKWRASFVREAGVAESWNFRDEKEPESASPGLGKIHPCWFDSGRAFVGIPGVQRADKGEAVTREFVGPVIVYPMDRSPSTPLPVFCPIDIMRNVLGVGPCQYILATEGLGAGEPPTPDNVTRWVEKQFERKRDRRAAGEIKERLDEMTRHIKNMQARIEQYADFATKVRQLCVVEEHNRDISEVARRLRSIMDDAGSDTAARGEATKAPLSAQEWAGAMSALIGKENALDECKRLGAEIQAIGAAQDKTLSKWRMAVRRLKQECRMVAAPPPAADFARKIQDRAEQMLRKRS